MYRTILLPEIPNAADRAILNKWCGLPTGYLPKPEYYWDVTGKSNSDTATRNTIKNLGTLSLLPLLLILLTLLLGFLIRNTSMLIVLVM